MIIFYQLRKTEMKPFGLEKPFKFMYSCEIVQGRTLSMFSKLAEVLKKDHSKRLSVVQKKQAKTNSKLAPMR